MKFPLAIYFVFAILMTSCNTMKYLTPDEVKLTKIETKIDYDLLDQQPKDLKSELVQFYKQKPNSKFLWIPREWYYYRNQDPSDTSWIKKWSKKTLAEEPAILDTTLINHAQQDMQNYLRNKKGYYNAVVEHEIQYKKKKAHVSYIVNPNRRYAINSLEYFTLDSMISVQVDSLEKTSILHPGDPIDALSFNVEKQRIVSSMQHIGFANFNLNHVSIKGDSSKLDHALDIFFEILPPTDSSSHKKYRIGSINVYTDFHQFQKSENLSIEDLLDKKFLRESKKFIVKPSLINRKIFLKPNDVFNSQNYDKSVKKLFNLEAYRFIKITPSINANADSLIDYRILMTPQNYLWAVDLGADLFFSNRSRIQQNLVGFSIGTSLENRNTFGGSEKFKLSVETGFEIAVGTNSNINNFSLGINNSLDIPKFTNAFNVLKLGNKVGLLKESTIQKMEEEASSLISVGFNFIDIINDYRISSFTTSYGFDIKFNNKHRILFNQTGLDYADYDIRANYKPIIENNEFLAKSFQPTLFTGLLFKDLSYLYQSDNGPNVANWALIANLEFSGLEIHGLNGLYNGISGKSSSWKIDNRIGFEKLLKFQVDGRWFNTIKRNAHLAARIKTGISLPYGHDNNGDKNVVSFIKQFLVGGPNSIRAWRPMQLGPGNYYFQDTSTTREVFFQRGDILLEFNLEYRFDLFWLMEGGLFFDGGNIWTLRDEVGRPGSQFSSNFFKQIALGYGWGIRFDFNYFLIRFDFGYKIRSPYLDPDTNSHFIPLNGQGLFGNFNVAVNYPF